MSIIKTALRYLDYLRPTTLKKLEESSYLLEKKHTQLKQKEKEYKQLNIQLKGLNINLKKELQNIKKQLEGLYSLIEYNQDKINEKKIQEIEIKIAGGFSHKMKNLFNPAILLFNNIYKKDLVEHNNKNLLEIFKILKANSTEQQIIKIIPVLEKINERQNKIEEIIEMSFKSIDKNINLINNFMEYSGIEKHDTLIQPNKIIAKVLNHNKERLSKNSIKVKTSLNNQGLVKGDHMQFIILIQNLLNNAIEAFKPDKYYKKKNKIVIFRTYKQENKFFIEIKDNGMGIARYHLEKIFDPFFTNNKKNGTGLGLALCKKIVKIYDGEIQVKSRAGSHTVFTIIFNEALK